MVVVLPGRIAPGDAPVSLPAAISHYRRDAAATRGDVHNRGFNDSFRFFIFFFSKRPPSLLAGRPAKRTTTEQIQSNKSRQVVEAFRR